MSRTDDIFTVTAMPVLANEQGPTVTYHPSGGDDKDIAAVCTLQPPGDIEDPDGGQNTLRTGEMVIYNDATLGIVSPNRADRVTINGEKWHIVDWWPVGNEWKLLLRRSVPLTKAAAAYQKPAL